MKNIVLKKHLHDIQSGRIDGLLISVTRETKNADHITKLQSAGVPVVLFDRQVNGISTAKVITNDLESGYAATRHLLEQGCSNPVFFSHSAALSICKERAEGFRLALKEAGFSTRNIRITYDRSSDEETGIYIKKFLAGKNRPDGILASVEKIAIQVYVAAEALSLSIPGELKVIAFSTLETAALLNPSLSTITQPAFDIGKTAATILFKGIEKNNFDLQAENIIIPSTLMPRKSTNV